MYRTALLSALVTAPTAIDANAQLPNLKPTFVRPSTPEIRAGDTDFKTTIWNTSNVGSPGFSYAIVLSPDAEVTPSDTRIAQFLHAGIHPTSPKVTTKSVTLAEPPFSGLAFVGVVADPDGRLPEAIETDNWWYVIWRSRRNVGLVLHTDLRLGRTPTARVADNLRATGLGDVDGDSFDDYAISDVWNRVTRIYSGRHNTVLREIKRSEVGFGTSLANAGDVDGDGVADLVVGAPKQDSVFVFSGATGVEIRSFRGENQGRDQLGHSVTGVGDLNDDGYDDFAAGAPAADKVHVFSGRSGRPMRVHVGERASAFGHSLDGVGDLDGDGTGDILAGAPDSQVPTVRVISGATGRTLKVLDGPEPKFGKRVAGGGDCNGDGVPDLIVGSPSAKSVHENAGKAYVYSGKDFRLLFSVAGAAADAALGEEVDNAGDVDGDGHDDVLVGSPGYNPRLARGGMARVYSGKTGKLMHNELWTSGGTLGGLVAGLGDLNGDGLADVAIGGDRVGGGLVQVLHSSGKKTGRGRTFGAPCAAASGKLPRHTFAGRPVLGSSVSLELRTAPGATPALFGVGNKWAHIRLDALGARGCTVLTTPLLWLPIPVGQDGRAGLSISIPTDPKLAGKELYSQWTIFDSTANSLGLILTNAVSLTLGTP